MLKGIDTSHYQPIVDYKALMAQGVSYAYHKATEGSSYFDMTFQNHRAACKNLGLPWGAYHFFQPLQDAMAQAATFCKAVGSLPAGTLPPILDLEFCPTRDGDKWASVAPADIIFIVKAWLWEVEKELGVKPGIYTSEAWWRQFGSNSDLFGSNPLWVAHYSPTPPGPFGGWTTWTFWQRDANVIDHDLFNGDDLTPILRG